MREHRFITVCVKQLPFGPPYWAHYIITVCPDISLSVLVAHID